MSFGYMYCMRINIHSTFYVETPGVKNARNVSQFEGYISKMSKRERICSHHKLNIGNAFVAVRRNIPDRRSHRVHELLQNEDLNLMFIICMMMDSENNCITNLKFKRKNNLLIFGEKKILNKLLDTNPVKECHDSDCRSNARACGEQVEQEPEVPERQDEVNHTFGLFWDLLL